MTILPPNRIALLATIGASEGTTTSPITGKDGYDVIVTGVDGKPEVFLSFADHPFMHRPPKVINSKGLLSDAAGRYQIMLHDWPYYKRLLLLPDFSPASQDAYAIQIIRETGALPLIDSGMFTETIARIAHLWASLPGADYADQHMQKMTDLIAIYTQAGGTFAS